MQSKVFEQATNIMGDTFEDMDIDKEQKDDKIDFLANKIGLRGSKVGEEMNELKLNKISCKRKGVRIIDRSNISRNNLKNNKKTKTKIFQQKKALIMTYL